MISCGTTTPVARFYNGIFTPSSALSISNGFDITDCTVVISFFTSSSSLLILLNPAVCMLAYCQNCKYHTALLLQW